LIKKFTFGRFFKNTSKYMSKYIKIKKGLDINLKGVAEKEYETAINSGFFALKPTDFPGLTPKAAAKLDDEVKAGTILFFDKYNPEVVFTSPVSGKLYAINRGEKRRILEFVVQADGKNANENFIKSKPEDLTREEIKQNILKSGCWPLIRQRPFNIIANTEIIPRDIFITTFNSAPLAADLSYSLKDEISAFQTGVNALKKLTDGKVYLGLKAKTLSNPFANTANVEKCEFDGPHPAGNVGIQINTIKPVNKGEIVWTLNAVEVTIIGRLFETGNYNPSKIIALVGSEVQKPKYYKTMLGAPINDLIDNRLVINKEKDIRIISGNVLSGEKVNGNGFLGFYHNEVTVIPEGNKEELFGWAKPGFEKFSTSRTFFAWLNPKKERIIDTKLHGGLRPFIVTGELEKVFPMNIFPMQILKSIYVKDLDLMEELGIYEIAEEDFALCEVINTSKIEIQKLVREGFEFAIKELG
jgi:Na+-transporting NADH:ubiquinone oxidoreductase subunit A